MRLIFIILLYLFPQLLISKTIPQERSALWVVRYAVTTKSDIDRVISTAIDLNISDIFFQVRALGYTYYNSQWESKAKIIQNDFDPLEYVIKEAAPKGIRVHAWVNMFYVWAGDQYPEDKNHILYRRSDYVLRNNGYPDYKSLKEQGYEGYFLDPKIIAVQNDLLRLIIEISENYDVAGIHLDYFRYPGIAYSFTPASRTIYMMNKVYDPWSIYQSPENFIKDRGYQVFLYADKEYRYSLTETLSKYLKLISKTVKNIKPDLELSIAVKPDPVEAKHRYFQDWLEWLRRGFCDFVVIMNYRTDWQEFDFILKQLAIQNLNEQIMVGISTYNQNVDAVLKRLKAVKNERFVGYSLFSYNYLIENTEYLIKFQHQLFIGR